MGRQISFYFMERDERLFLQILSTESVEFYRGDPGPDKSPVIYNEFSLNPCTDVTHPQVLVCRRGDEAQIRFLETRDSGRYFIDSVCSPVIEFTRSGYNAGSDTLVSGSLWYEHTYSDEDQNGRNVLAGKAEELKRLYERLAEWIETHCQRLPNGNYIAPHAAESYGRGAKLSP
jgi:hypothetical protein